MFYLKRNAERLVNYNQMFKIRERVAAVFEGTLVETRIWSLFVS